MAFLGMADPEQFRSAIRAGCAVTYTVDARRQGALVASGLQPTGGSITDTTKPGVRRMLSLSLADESGDLYDVLAPVGTQLTVTAHVRYSSRSTVDVPMGVFDVDTQSRDEATGAISLTAPDRWVRIQRARFVRPEVSQAGQYVTFQIASLIRGALGAAEPVQVLTLNTTTVGSMVWEQDRDKAIMELAEGIGCWVFFDRFGVATIADLPRAGAAADWLVDASATGVLTELSRERSRTSTSNVVVVSSSATDAAFDTQVVWDAIDSSPTYAGLDPVNAPETAGPFGIVPFYYDTPLPLGNAGAYQTGFTILARESGLASQVSLGQVPNPAVDAFDTLEVVPPAATQTTVAIEYVGASSGSLYPGDTVFPGDNVFPSDGGRPVRRVKRSTIGAHSERHVADTVTHPLSLGQAQVIDGRSTSIN